MRGCPVTQTTLQIKMKNNLGWSQMILHFCDCIDKVTTQLEKVKLNDSKQVACRLAWKINHLAFKWTMRLIVECKMKKLYDIFVSSNYLKYHHTKREGFEANIFSKLSS